MPELCALPEDILRHIISFIPNEDIHVLRAVSKVTKSIAESRMRSQNGAPVVWSAILCSNAEIARFFKTYPIHSAQFKALHAVIACRANGLKILKSTMRKRLSDVNELAALFNKYVEPREWDMFVECVNFGTLRELLHPTRDGTLWREQYFAALEVYAINTHPKTRKILRISYTMDMIRTLYTC